LQLELNKQPMHQEWHNRLDKILIVQGNKLKKEELHLTHPLEILLQIQHSKTRRGLNELLWAGFEIKNAKQEK